MSSLDLEPDFRIVAVQTGVFLVNLYVVKKFFIEPFLTLKDKRMALTVGSENEVKGLQKKCEEKTSEVSKRLNQAWSDIKTYRITEKEKARNSAQEDIENSKAQAKKQLDEMRESLSSQLKNERTKVPEYTKALANEIYTAILA